MLHHAVDVFDSDDENVDRIAAVVVVALEAEGLMPVYYPEDRDDIMKALIRVAIGLRSQ